MMTQTLAIFLDAYRDLNARKLFWTVLGLNIFAMLIFALLGANDHAMTFLWYEPFGNFLTAVDYKKIYSNVVVGFWFTWVSAILALISTAGIFPDLMSSGSIDLYLAKPIARLRLFLTKYAAGLLFVALQVTVFATLSFFVLGFRAGIWEPGLFLAVPLVLLFFSYLFGISVLFGVMTRSTIAAVLLTILVWGGIALVNYVDEKVGQGVFLMNAIEDTIPARIDAYNARIDALKQQQAAQTRPEAPATKPGEAPATSPDDSPLANQIHQMEEERDSLVEARDKGLVPGMVVTVQRVIFDVKTFLPKTRETLSIMDRFLFRDRDLQDAARFSSDDLDNPATGPSTRVQFRGPARGARAEMNQGSSISPTLIQAKLDRQRSVWWIIGTSLLFEAACLAIAAWIFCTRDF